MKVKQMKTYNISGADALRLAERDNLTVFCHANPVDDGGAVEIGVARQIAKDSPSLVYIRVQPHGWIDAGGRAVSEMQGYHVDDYFTADGMYCGPDPDQIEPRWNDSPLTPETERAS